MVDISINAASINQLACIPIPAITAFFITSNTPFPFSHILKTFFNICIRTINPSVKFARFLVIFHIVRSGASSPINSPYTKLLSKACPAIMSRGHRNI